MSAKEWYPLFGTITIGTVPVSGAVAILPPASHARDPQTSARAERRHTASGRRVTHLRIVVELVTRSPGLSARGYAELLLAQGLIVGEPGEVLYEVRRRLTDAARLGYVEQGPQVQLEGHSAETTWKPTNGGSACKP